MHYLNAQSGPPNRETEGTVYWDNDGLSPIVAYMDPTPYENEEFRSMTETGADLGEGRSALRDIIMIPWEMRSDGWTC